MCFSVCAEWIGLPVDCGRAGGREGGNSSSHGADLSKGCSADDGGRSAEGPRRCMGHLRIVGGRRLGRRSFVRFRGVFFVVDGDSISL